MVTWDRIRYRIRQFIETLLTPLLPIDEAYVKRTLSGSESPGTSAQLADRLWVLFRSLRRSEQHHAIAVSKALEAQGRGTPELLIAALFHDVGKSLDTPRLLERVWVVVVEHFAPGLAERWGRGESRWIGRGFAIRRAHSAWGAQLVEQAGAPQRVVELIRDHHSPAIDDADLAALQTADEA